MAELSDSKQLRRAIEKIAADVIARETRNCLRTYKAVVVEAPSGATCTVRLIGESATLTLPYSSRVEGVTEGDAVMIATLSNNLSNSVVWEKVSFSGASTRPGVLELLYTEGAEITPTDWGSANVKGGADMPSFGYTRCAKITLPDTQVTPVSFSYAYNLEEFDSGAGMVATNSTGGNMFAYSNALKKVTLGISCLPFGTYSFFGANAITEVHYRGTVDQWAAAPRATNYRWTSPFAGSGEGHFYIGDSATPLTELVIRSDSITRGAFAYFTDIKLIDIGANVPELLNQTFIGCSALDTLILRGSSVKTLGGAAALSGTPIASGTGFIYVPSALLVDYKADTNWATYADQFRTIEDYPDIA